MGTYLELIKFPTRRQRRLATAATLKCGDVHCAGPWRKATRYPKGHYRSKTKIWYTGWPRSIGLQFRKNVLKKLLNSLLLETYNVKVSLSAERKVLQARISSHLWQYHFTKHFQVVMLNYFWTTLYFYFLIWISFSKV